MESFYEQRTIITKHGVDFIHITSPVLDVLSIKSQVKIKHLFFTEYRPNNDIELPYTGPFIPTFVQTSLTCCVTGIAKTIHREIAYENCCIFL